jgi:hypothetical protein
MLTLAGPLMSQGNTGRVLGTVTDQSGSSGDAELRFLNEPSDMTSSWFGLSGCRWSGSGFGVEQFD